MYESPAVARNERLFNFGIVGHGILCLEFPCPKEELVEISLDNDMLNIRKTVRFSSLDRTVL